MTILHLVNDYSGAARYSKELMKFPVKCLDLEIIYIFTNQKQIQELIIERNQYNVIVFIPIFEIYYVNKNQSALSTIINIISQYIKFHEKIIIHNNGSNNTIDFRIIRNVKFEMMQTVHFVPISKTIFNLFEKVIYFIFVTKFALNSKDVEFITNAKLIYNGVSESIAMNDGKSIRAKYGFCDNEILVLYVGRIDESKGIAVLAKVFGSLDLDDARLVIVGSGAYDLVLNEIEANHSKIIFLGELENQQVHNLMAACDIGVIPSLNEQCSYVALEMMSHGMAIIASEVRGMGELFIGRDIALTVPVDYSQDDIPTLDTEVLKQHIITLASDKKLRKRLGENARCEWAEKYTAERMARETFEVYKELAAQF